MFSLDIEHDNSTDTLRILSPDELGDDNAPSLQSLSTTRRLTKQPEWPDRAECIVYQDAWEEVEQDLDETDDRLLIREDGNIIFGGRLTDAEINGTTVSVIINSPKRDAIDAEPSGGNDIYPPQEDSSIVTNELLPRVNTVDAGTIETVESGISFSESHASPGKSLSKLGREADAEIRYRATENTFEVDYVSRLGDDRTDELIAPGSATVVSEPRIRENTTENVTHVIVLGAGEGTAQTRAEAVVSGFDPNTDRPVYRQRKDKDIQSQDRAESLAQTLVNEYDGEPEYLEVDCEVPASVAPKIGDTFTVQLPENGVDSELRVITRERLVDSGGDRYRLVLSNRRHTADLKGEQNRVELESLSEGNAGQYYAFADGEGWDALDSSEPYEFSVYRPPNTIGELRAVLRVESRPYRLRAAQSGHTHDVDIGVTSASNDDFEALAASQQNTTGTALDNFNTIEDTFSPGSVDTSEVLVGASLRVDAGGSRSDSNLEFGWQVYFQNQDTGYEQFLGNYRFTINTDENPVGSINIINREADFVFAVDPTNCRNETLELRFEPFFIEDPDNIASQCSFSVFSNWIAVGQHTHNVNATETTSSTAAVEPGIVEQTNETVSGVDVTVAGNTVTTNLDHPIDESIDLEGVLSDGRNDIEITSDTLGEIRATLEYEAIKNADSR